ncbi:surface lipoprotein assembly modifier [Oceanicola sp. S124]|uniref:surface lipoprotein assembly modifier n=1 Tax=Oceanicola sp. S124 TaxID=1042378 RepID=UPI0002557E11|nr:surface lipoprotein assembly modifier [Oceanicola sp. S124]
MQTGAGRQRRQGLRALGLVLALALQVGPGQGRAEQDQALYELTPVQMRTLAAARLQRGDAGAARALAQALLKRDPRDFAAQLLLAQAARALGEDAEAGRAAAAAWDLAGTDEERYAAALIRAQVLASAGHHTRAQIWLRRAAEAAPSPATRARAIRDFRYVRLRNPWSTRFSLAVTPTDNINNGSSNDRFTIDGLPWEFALSGDAQALGGVELSFGADTRYRLGQTATEATDLLLRASHRSYSLSSEAQAAAPDAKGSDYAYTSLAAGLGRRMLLGARGNELAMTAWAGQNWYGGDPYGAFLRGEARLQHALSSRDRLTTSLSLEARRGEAAPEADVGLLSLGWDHAWTGGQVSLYGSYTRSSSDFSAADYSDLRLGARLAPKADWLGEALGADPLLTLETRSRDFDRSPYSFDGRQDEEIRAELQVTFRDLDYMGFNPVVTLETAKTTSNIAIYDTTRTGLGLSVRSAF